MYSLSKWSSLLSSTIAAFLCAFGCGKTEDRYERPEQQTIAASFKYHNRFASEIKNASALVVYEGLPHHAWERSSLTNELATKKTLILGAHHFYEEPLSIAAQDAKALKEIYCDNSSFRPFGGVKKCGGYHPDYCMKWTNGTNDFLVQICFGCHEMKTFSQGKELYCDIEQRAFTRLEKTLKKYRKNRPESEI